MYSNCVTNFWDTHIKEIESKTNVHEKPALALEISNSSNNCDVNDQTNGYESIDELSDDTVSDDNFDSCRVHDFKNADLNTDSIEPETYKIINFEELSKNKMMTPILRKRKLEVVTIDISIHPLIEPYSKLIFSLQEHHLEEDSQRGRHLIEMLKWSVVDRDIFIEVGWKCDRMDKISIPRIKFNLVAAVLQDYSDQRLHSSAMALKALKDKRKLGNSTLGWLVFPTFIENLFTKKSNYYDLDVLTVVTAISAVSLYKPTQPHPVVSEFNRILSSLHDPSEDEVNQVRLHIGLVNAATIHLSVLEPIYNEEQQSLTYVRHENEFSFNLQTQNPEVNIENTLKLITYIRETICAD
ncbi:2124_t:CDS:2, partial [Gigaspora rosea]